MAPIIDEPFCTCHVEFQSADAVVLYARVSSIVQFDNGSLHRQLDTLREHATACGLRIAGEFSEVVTASGVRPRNLESKLSPVDWNTREGFYLALSAAYFNGCPLLVLTVDRVLRNRDHNPHEPPEPPQPADLAELRFYAGQVRIAVVEPDAGKAHAGRVSKGIRKAREAGERLRPAVKPTACDTLMLELHRAGSSHREVANALNEAGLRTPRGLTWDKSKVRDRLRKTPAPRAGEGK